MASADRIPAVTSTDSPVLSGKPQHSATEKRQEEGGTVKQEKEERMESLIKGLLNSKFYFTLPVFF